METKRLTRSSLARFAYTNGSHSAENATESLARARGAAVANGVRQASTRSLAIEAVTATRKRKRTLSTTKAEDSTASTLLKTEPDETKDGTSTAPSPSTPRRVRRPARTHTSPTTGLTTVTPPTDWEEMYALVKEMRLSGPAAHAAVDTMGCERLAAAEATPLERRYHTLTALMLSSQTKDTVTAAAMARLQTELPPAAPGLAPGLTLANVLAVPERELDGLIAKVGFHGTKARYIKQTAVLLRDRWGGDIPPTVEGLMSLPGVGPKMAYLCVGAPDGWNRVEGIGVDVHVHRITNLWGWNGAAPTKTPEDTRKALQAWLPRERWREINWLLVGFGQKVCLPVGRKCGECEVGLRGLCRAADRKKVLEGRRLKELDGGVKKDEDGEDMVKKEETDEAILDLEDVAGRIKEESPRRKPKRSIK